MRALLLIVASCSAAAVAPAAATSHQTSRAARDARPRVLIDNARVRVYRTTAGALAGVDHVPAVIVSLDDAAGGKAGSAVWVPDAAAPPPAANLRGTIVIVQPRTGASAPPPAAAARPGDAPSTGMSFTPMFENDLVSVLRARMDVGAREGFHTHASDTIVVHLSGGAIEDTADGKTVVNRWTHGDAEFEALGSSHSARNVGGAVDVVLVVLKPR
jgi:quercetin dioxygenase-like cupin family protein